MFGFGILTKFVKPYVLIPLLILIILVQGYFLLKPRAHKPDVMRRSIAEQVCWEAADRIDRELEERHGEEMAIAHFKNDPSRFVTEKMIHIMSRKGKFTIPEETLIDNILKKLDFDETQSEVLNDIIVGVKAAGGDLLLDGNVREFRSTQDKAVCTISFAVYDVDTEETLTEFTITRRRFAGPFGTSWHVFMLRCLAWLVIVLALPILGITVVRNVVEMESNVANTVLLLLYGIIGAVLGLLLIGMMGPPWWQWFTIIVTFIFSMMYVWYIAAKLVQG